MDGIRAEIVVADPGQCEVAAASGDCGPVGDVSRGTVPATTDGNVRDEFTVYDEDAPAELAGAEAIFRDDCRTIYRSVRTVGRGCVCERVEREGCTVRHVRAVDGRLHVTFLATDLDAIRNVVASVGESHDGVRIDKLVRASPSADESPLWVADPDRLTQRQREVLETAHRMGYFEHPREASAAEVAEELGVATPTFTEHLAAAQRKVLEECLGSDPEQNVPVRRE